MSRHHLEFGCGSLKLAGTLDTAPGTVGLLIVSGGNELRSGAFSGHSQLAAKLARKGFPVFRFDRRGIGDSPGENRGFTASSGDIRAALEAFRAMAPQVERVFAFGNCDAASALMLAGGEGCDGLILSNPWTLDEPDTDQAQADKQSEPVHAPEAIRARYIEKLKDPREIWRLLKGGVDLRKLAKGLTASLRPSPPPSGLIDEMRAGFAQFKGETHFLIAEKDRTAQLFQASWGGDQSRFAICKSGGHSYVEPEHRLWLENEILKALRGKA